SRHARTAPRKTRGKSSAREKSWRLRKLQQSFRQLYPNDLRVNIDLPADRIRKRDQNLLASHSFHFQQRRTSVILYSGNNANGGLAHRDHATSNQIRVGILPLGGFGTLAFGYQEIGPPPTLLPR